MNFYMMKTYKIQKIQIYAIFALALLLFLCMIPVYGQAEETEETKQLSDKVRTMTYNGYTTRSCYLFGSYQSKQPLDVLPGNTQVEILAKSTKYERTKIRYNNVKYYVKTKVIKYTSCNYTTQKYTASQKLAFVNRYRSRTKFLIWISHYTQEVNIFRGKKGTWQLIKTYPCTTGSHDRRTPHGIFKIGKKERKWDHYNRYISFVTHFKGRNAFHTRIHRKKAYGGGYYYPTLGAPGSNGCIRLYDKDAKYIYRFMPKGTTVISF